MWRAALAKGRGVRQITWLCGTERVLMEEVISEVRAALDLDPWSYISLAAGSDSERLIWTELNQHPVGGGNRLAVIRNAENLKDWSHLISWVKARSENPKTHVIFVSNEEKVPRIPPTEDERRKNLKGATQPHIATITGKGHIIECRPYTSSTAHHAVAWVQSKVKMREGIAGHLLERANGDLRMVRDLCVKLALFPAEITLTTINGMLAEQPRDSFSDALLALDKPTALLALEKLPVSEYGRMIGLLDARLDLAGLVHDMQTEYKTPSEIARAAGNKNFLVKELLPVAKHYDPKRRLQIRTVLSTADETIRGGASVGVMEAIVVFW